MMIIAVPLCQQRFSQHFGGADTFALYAVDTAAKVVTSTTVLQPPEHDRGVFPTWLREQGATVVLAGGMGPRAVSIFRAQGVEVLTGIEETSPDEAVRKFIEGTLEASGELCHDHSHHDCGHHH
jgi:ATP-binding protein involved in chromosome partitioning